MYPPTSWLNGVMRSRCLSRSDGVFMAIGASRVIKVPIVVAIVYGLWLQKLDNSPTLYNIFYINSNHDCMPKDNPIFN